MFDLFILHVYTYDPFRIIDLCLNDDAAIDRSGTNNLEFTENNKTKCYLQSIARSGYSFSAVVVPKRQTRKYFPW